MHVKQSTQKKVLEILSNVGAVGATITEIEKDISYERHTLSKYLSFMQAQGLIYHKVIGKAKLWFIDKAPIKTILHSLPHKKTFIEGILANILKNIPMALFVIDENYNVIFQDEKALNVYGDLAEQIFYKTVLGYENPLKISEITELIFGNIDSTEVMTHDVLGNTLRIHASRLINPDGSKSIILILNDITEKQKVKDKLKKNKSLLESEKSALNKAIIMIETDLLGKIIHVNKKYLEISGYSSKEVIGKTNKIINSGYHPKEFFNQMWKTIESGNIWNGLIKNKRKDGTLYWADLTITPVLHQGKPIKYYATMHDLSKYLK
jgi:PAS domain S-box-containing protein